MNKEIMAKLRHKGEHAEGGAGVGDMEGAETLSEHIETQVRKPKSTWNLIHSWF